MKHLGLRLPRIPSYLSWVFHPITFFALIQVSWITTIVLWQIQILDLKEGYDALLAKFDLPFSQDGHGKNTLLILIVGNILVGIIGFGSMVLFYFAQRQRAINKQQRIFLSSVTHELRSPLASLQLGLETVSSQKTMPLDSVKNIYQMMRKDIDRLFGLVDKVLVSSRLDRGVLRVDELNSENSTLESIILASLRSLEVFDPKVKEKVKIEMETNPMMREHVEGIRVIVTNFVENALKYSQGDIRVRVAKKGSTVVFSIRDSGPGMSAKECRKCFKIFARLDHAVKNAVPGTGLGLFIAKEIANTMGAEVWAESEGEGKGTTFFLEMKLKDEFPSVPAQILKSMKSSVRPQGDATDG